MGLIELASSNSFWRGVDYYKSGKVIVWRKNEKDTYSGTVKGSYGKRYDVFVDVEHPRKSKCSCPFAADKRVICKHMLALYFTAEPKALEDYFDEMEEYECQLEEEEERQSIEHKQELLKKAKLMSKSDLIEELVQAWLKIEEYETKRFY
ncbi:MAG: SWIM zinc finger domain-containing protein [Lachnospiraceae bacterium]|nr:SWIM zinc finger domain-containing protein [Lachnospiraceae bacterium]